MKYKITLKTQQGEVYRILNDELPKLRFEPNGDTKLTIFRGTTTIAYFLNPASFLAEDAQETWENTEGEDSDLVWLPNPGRVPNIPPGWQFAGVEFSNGARNLKKEPIGEWSWERPTGVYGNKEQFPFLIVKYAIRRVRWSYIGRPDRSSIPPVVSPGWKISQLFFVNGVREAGNDLNQWDWTQVIGYITEYTS